MRTLLLLILCSGQLAFGQTTLCDSIIEFPEVEASFANEEDNVLDYFLDHLIDIVYDSDSGEFPPSSFSMIVIINDNDEVVAIEKMRSSYSKEVQNELLAVLQKEQGFKSGEVNGQKICSRFYFVISCILWN